MHINTSVSKPVSFSLPAMAEAICAAHAVQMIATPIFALVFGDIFFMTVGSDDVMNLVYKVAVVSAHFCVWVVVVIVGVVHWQFKRAIAEIEHALLLLVAESVEYLGRYRHCRAAGLMIVF